MNRPILLVSTIFVVSALSVAAQDASQAANQPAAQQDNGAYQGVSHPPSDDVIVTSEIPAPKPPAGKPMVDAAAAAGQVTVQTNVQTARAPYQSQPQPSSVDPSVNFPSPLAGDGTDDGIVRVAPSNPQNAPMLNERMNQQAYAADPDGDIVHAQPLRPGELQEGTSIRVHLLERLSTAET
jgi:hypothetical protein